MCNVPWHSQKLKGVFEEGLAILGELMKAQREKNSLCYGSDPSFPLRLVT